MKCLNDCQKTMSQSFLAHGEWEGRRYEVTDFISQSNYPDLISTLY